jgi:uncharacterized protein (DUF1778 family)
VLAQLSPRVAGSKPALPGRRALQPARVVCPCKRGLVYAIVIHSQKKHPIIAASILSVRVSDDERSLLEAASEQAHTNLSDFVRRKAIEAAEIEFLERRVVTIPASDWEAFEAWAHRPARKIAALKKPLRTPQR